MEETKQMITTEFSSHVSSNKSSKKFSHSSSNHTGISHDRMLKVPNGGGRESEIQRSYESPEKCPSKASKEVSTSSPAKGSSSYGFDWGGATKFAEYLKQKKPDDSATNKHSNNTNTKPDLFSIMGFKQNDDKKNDSKKSDRPKMRFRSNPNIERADMLYAIGEEKAKEEKWEDALKLYNKTLVLQRRALGKDHPTTARTLNSIGIALTNLGDIYGAMTSLEEALWIRQQTLGCGDKDVVETTNNLFSLLNRVNGNDEGEDERQEDNSKSQEDTHNINQVKCHDNEKEKKQGNADECTINGTGIRHDNNTGEHTPAESPLPVRCQQIEDRQRNENVYSKGNTSTMSTRWQKQEERNDTNNHTINPSTEDVFGTASRWQ